MNTLLTQLKTVTKQNPKAVAYDYLGKTATYQELDQRSTKLAHYLADSQLPAKSPILVYGGQTFEMVIAFIACLKSGHAYIPVDTNSSNERLTTILTTAQPSMVISVEPFPIPVAISQIDAAQLHEIDRTPSRMTKLMPVELNDNVYIIFTSGTTGKPKGVQISQANLLSFCSWMTTDFNFDQQNVLLQPPFSFDLSVMALYPTLLRGGTLRVLPQKMTRDFQKLFLTLSKLPLSVWVSTPSLAEMCLLDPFFNQERYPSLKQFFFCGEELTHQTAQRLKRAFPQAHIYNTYGPTEATVAVTSVEITDEILARYPRLPIGYVKPDTTVMVVNQSKQQSGELVIQGPGVSRGYLRNPEKTAQAFGQAPHAQFNNYRTGDLGYFEEQLLFYQGRSDFQIKMNGYRIELEEINQSLAKVPLIEKGVVVPRYDHNHKVHQLIAFVSLRQQVSADLDQMITKIKAQLTPLVMPYMMPQRFVQRQKLPMSPNGKVDVKALIAEVNADA